MSKTPAQIRANTKYDKKTYGHMAFKVRRDAEINASVIRAYAAARGESLGCFIRRAVAEAIQRDNAFSNKE